MIIRNNFQANNALRNIGIFDNRISKSSNKLGSGYRINVSADDAAGLSISEKMRGQIRGLNRASKNAQEGISFVQTAEGALDESHSILQRCRELTVQAASDVNTDEDRSAIQAEIEQLNHELDRICEQTEFNKRNVFLNNIMSTTVEINGTTITTTSSFVDPSGYKWPEPTKVGPVGDKTNYTDTSFVKLVQDAAEFAVAKMYSEFGGSLFGTSSKNIHIGLEFSNVDGTGSTLAFASLSMSGYSDADGSYITMTYNMTIDEADYSNYSSMTAEEKADLASVVAHEMVHLVMFDTLTYGMIGGRSTTLPQWFKEGMAQTISGDNGWLSAINTSSSDTTLKNYMSK